MICQPLTENCGRVLARGDTCVLGISPFNSYFSQQRIACWTQWARKHFRRIFFYLPDEPSAFTLEALGYEPSRAARKARRQSAWLRNKILRAQVDCSVAATDAESAILDSRRLRENQTYQELIAHFQREFYNNTLFRLACLATSSWVLQRHQGDAPLSDEAQLSATRYLLAEMPLFLSASALLENRPTVFCYHQRPPLLQQLFQRELGPQPVADQGYIVLRDPP